MEDVLKKIASKRLSQTPNTQAVNALTSFISNNPHVSYEELVRKAVELGQNPEKLIEQALGSVIVDKNGLNLKNNTTDLLNEVYESNPVPGYRYVVDPNNDNSATGKEIANALYGNEGIASGWRYKGEARGKPDFVAVEDAKDEIGKMRALVTGGHELKHGEDRMIRPHFKSKLESGEMGHHFGPGTFESQDLIRQVRDLPEDDRVVNEIIKRSKGLDRVPFKALKSIAPVLAKAGLATAGGTMSLAAEAADSEDMGGAAEQSAFLRERDEMVRRKDAMSSASPEQQQGLNKMYEEMDNGQASNTLRDFDPQSNQSLRVQALNALAKK